MILMGLFNFKLIKKKKFSNVKQSYWGSKSKVPIPKQKNDDDALGDEDVCAHKYCAEEQRKSEVKRLGTDAGCEGYKKMGCYECQGRKEDCYAYTKMPKRVKS